MGRRILFVLGEACWLTGIGRFLEGIEDDVQLATYDFRERPSIHTFPISAEAGDVASWIESQSFDLVVLLTNQDALLRDAEIAERLQNQGILVVAQPRDVAIVGQDKIRQKLFLQSIQAPLGAFRVAESVDQAIVHCEELGFPAVLKMPNLSDGRKMGAVWSADDVLQHYYRHAITQPVLVEEFIRGIEVSTIAFSHGGGDTVFPLVYKGRTDYLFGGTQPTQRVYFSPHQPTCTLGKEIQRLATTVAASLGSQGLLGLDLVVADSKLHIIEMNTRMVQTLWMSMHLTNVNLFRTMVLAGLGESRSSMAPSTSGLAIELSIPTGIAVEKLVAIRQKEGFWSSETRVVILGSSHAELLRRVRYVSELFDHASLYDQVLQGITEYELGNAGKQQQLVNG